MPRKVRHLRDLRRLAAHALLHGAVVQTANRVFWDASGGCQDPYPFTLEGRSPILAFRDDWGDVKIVNETSEKLVPAQSNEYGYMRVLWLDIDAPCRKCPACLARRQAHWAYRAKSEISVAPRTWFATLTANPDWQTTFKYRAAIARDKRGVELYAEGPDEMFRALSGEFGREVTKWLKRVRKNTGARLRYILVAEAHKSGLPHMHLLIHEVHGSSELKWRQLHDEWKCGFSQFKLIEDSRAAWYVCKYLGKTALARVRASQLYGK